MGKLPKRDNVYVATGHFRNGILLAPVTGKLMSELILTGKTSVPLDPFSPSRFG
jgi:glycine/D-amino acid oxidase-like deaminating enzyme